MHCNDSGKSSVKMTNYSKPVVTKSERKFPYNIHQNQLGFNSSNALLLGEYANQRKSQDTTCLFSRNWRIPELPEKNQSQKSRKKKAKSDYVQDRQVLESCPKYIDKDQQYSIRQLAPRNKNFEMGYPTPGL